MDCVFCKIMEGTLPSSCIYEDEFFKVILDIAPASKGHTLIISKEHAADIFALSDEAAARLMPLAKKVAAALQSAFNPVGLNILQNNGAPAGQTVFHYHMQLIPRYENDNVNIKWVQGKHEPECFSGMLAEIKAKL